MKAIDLMPGQYVRFKQHYQDVDGLICGAGSQAMIITVPGPLQSAEKALVLFTDGRLRLLVDWWLRLHCEVIAS